jgi:hypothetical protein
LAHATEKDDKRKKEITILTPLFLASHRISGRQQDLNGTRKMRAEEFGQSPQLSLKLLCILTAYVP